MVRTRLAVAWVVGIDRCAVISLDEPIYSFILKVSIKEEYRLTTITADARFTREARGSGEP